MVYRPTVRYPDLYKDYVEEIYKATKLDRNQIIRLALFIAAHSPEYKAILKKHKIGDVSLPYPGWGIDEENAWKDQNYIKKEKQPEPEPKNTIEKSSVQDPKKVIEKSSNATPPPLIKIIDKGGIQIKIG